MRVVIGADHAGFELKQKLVGELERLQHEAVDVGTHDAAPCDYPDFAEAVGAELLGRRAERGVLVCGSGVGASIAANKMPGIRAGLCHDLYSAAQGVEHDDMNVLVLGARVIDAELAGQLMEAFLTASFSGAARHVRRLEKIRQLERRYSAPTGA